MSWLVVIGVFVLLIAVLSLLAAWQRKIEEVEKVRALADIREAKEQGTDRPLTQHPHIDVQACIGCGSCVAACPEDEVLGLVNRFTGAPLVPVEWALFGDVALMGAIALAFVGAVFSGLAWKDRRT